MVCRCSPAAGGLTAGRAWKLGADGWAAGVGDALALLRDWRREPPKVDDAPVRLDASALEIERRAEELGDLACASIQQRHPQMADHDDRQRARNRKDLVSIVRFVAAARLVDPEVFAEFLGWLEVLAIDTDARRSSGG